MEIDRTLLYEILNYQKRYKEELSSVLLEQLDDEQSSISRKNFKGHITASCFVLDPKMKNVLVLHHKKLDKFLQPGGHIDDYEMPKEAALRELEEETGITKDDIEFLDKLPFRIDTHTIPKNSSKKEDEHLHHDLGYLLKLKEDVEIKLNDESNSYKWIPITEFFSKNLIKRLTDFES